MGILNVTPDSFSDGGRYHNEELAITQAKRMVAEGADIIDIGGESTRPGATFVEAEQELERVLPIIRAVANEVDVPISIDTYKAAVAREAINAGATIINDVWGAKWDKDIAHVAAEYDVPIVLTHNRKNAQYRNLLKDIVADLQESISLCKQAGIREENLILDPGIGFAKTYEENMEVMRHLEDIVAIGYPVLLGTSRKSIIAKTLNLPVDERMEGTGATVCYGVMKGCSIMRVHDVKEMARMTAMMDGLIRKGES